MSSSVVNFVPRVTAFLGSQCVELKYVHDDRDIPTIRGIALRTRTSDEPHVVGRSLEGLTEYSVHLVQALGKIYIDS